ncbi:hypothetical protein [Agarivorans sp. 1_MG-2023]|uniref:hypothetical protein n=1 Tax=Agarivorans sp. 1_MG-2023 TaxID=3062634 RepID=UPI0026E20A7B|nr:hypothetical protein [Agarivorans sp. 1_MG-2023]MDO6765234.1 hypothetical protein [Agarivorans sp. 1_MG-2023]
MDIISRFLGNISLWELMVLAAIIYVVTQPELRKRITKLKFGQFELELQALKEDLEKGKERIVELESEMENDRRQFDDILQRFDPNAPVGQLAHARQVIKAEARNLSETDTLADYLSLKSSAEELYVAAVSIREKRPVALLPELIRFLDELASNKELGGFRLNTIWTLTSGLHRTLIACIRDGVTPMPDQQTLAYAQQVLLKLNNHSKVQSDRPDAPLKGIQGPIKHAQTWLDKAITADDNSDG